MKNSLNIRRTNVGPMIAMQQRIANAFGLEYGSPVTGHEKDIFTSAISLPRNHTEIFAEVP
jgi:hypothetical protein